MNFIYPFQLTASDYPDDESFACLIFIIGCDNSCEGCQNPEFKKYKLINSTELSNMKELLMHIEDFCKKNHTNKIVLSGGDPLAKNNISDTKILLKLLKKKKYKICVYTGHDISYVKANKVKYFEFIKCNGFDVNKYQSSKKTDLLLKFASTNQELYNSKMEKISDKGVYIFL
jgi:organic radical activating enzyme